ncbi:MAG: putative MFS-type transporter YcaD [Alphaproteobacteria bacterium MarineAlpha2_Bin1]|nr:MAG: putative MFS-type transporter YcaD [Alphaproteobacteria bacterium MarineAlpha2_Bin1]
MTKNLISISSLLLGIAIFMLGNGPLPTYLAIRLTNEGIATWIIGLIMSQYYVGFIIGPYFVQKLIESVGHIRSFIVLGSTMSAITLFHIFINHFIFWGFFRLTIGVCAIGMFMCVESWLNARATNNNRGQVFSYYIIAVYLFSGIGQFILQIPDERDFMIFIIFSILMSFAIIPIALTKLPPPEIINIEKFSLMKLWNKSPTGMTFALMGGVVSGAFYSIGPVFAQLNNFDKNTTALFISSVTIGGLILQWPVGKISDGKDRRKFMLAVAILLITISILISIFNSNIYLFLILSIIFGGLIALMYPLGVAYTNDYLNKDELLSATSGLVIAYGIGAIIGPLFASLIIEFTNSSGLFSFFSGIGILTAAIIIWRMSQRDSLSADMQSDYVAMPKTSPIINNLDPRGEELKN